MQYSTPVLVTCDEDAEAFALAELREMVPKLPPVTWIKDGTAAKTGIARVQPGISFDAFAATVERFGPLFIRHIAPVQREVALQAADADMVTLCAATSEVARLLDPARTFAVQSRLLGEERLPYRRVGLNKALSQALEGQTGACMDCRLPDQIVSVLCTPTAGCLGVSRAEQNRSLWPGGNHRFKRDERRISRSEFKLLEAMSVFQLALPKEGTALDIGAAPGGWTRVLRERGLRVVAVDPAELDPRLYHDAGVVHIRERIQPYLPHAGRFSVIVNDLKMEARASVEIMLRARRCLEPGGIAIQTLKLPKAVTAARTILAHVRLDIARLSQGYRILGARQLFHNRSEVTVVLQART